MLVFTRAAPRQVDKGRQRSGRLRSSSPLVIRGRADRIEKQKNKLLRLLWTACGRFELRKKLHRPACPQPWTQFRGWRWARSGKPADIKKRAEAHPQRHHSNLRINLIPPPPGSIFVCHCKHFFAKRWAFLWYLRSPLLIRIKNNSPDCLLDLSRQRRSRRVKSCREPPPEQPAASDSAIYVDPQGAQ